MLQVTNGETPGSGQSPSVPCARLWYLRARCFLWARLCRLRRRRCRRRRSALEAGSLSEVSSWLESVESLSSLELPDSEVEDEESVPEDEDELEMAGRRRCVRVRLGLRGGLRETDDPSSLCRRRPGRRRRTVLGRVRPWVWWALVDVGDVRDREGRAADGRGRARERLEEGRVVGWRRPERERERVLWAARRRSLLRIDIALDAVLGRVLAPGRLDLVLVPVDGVDRLLRAVADVDRCS